ncbi:MAG TPA: DNA polymerase III subunit delta [Cyanobacteria bacterium UBA11369]|nr:DNA polymerase III subunit delta [Cyanobacteria bacterium UBA11371]HBE34987.1 DNA polymerase III subunit delta [Cyanobacteria bacterium UBA11368]HBE49043.1 DNA polymerase III subunit delta [Cyanobacteria bacterium UBA11369]
MISLLVGDDVYAISKKLSEFKTSLDPTWINFNYHRFNAEALEEAIDCALTRALGRGRAKLVVVEDCNFKQFTEETLKILQLISQVTEQTHLVFVASGIDKRLKVAKFLLSQGKLFEFDLIPPWRTDLIAKAIGTLCRGMGLSLDRNIIEYLAGAIGNDSARVEAELHKLASYSNGGKLSVEEVRSLVPSTTQNSLQLAEAIRESNLTKAVNLLQELLEKETFPLAICATLITQFRTWMWVKAALVGGVKQDAEIARICQIANPKRVYFLKQEVASTTLKSLSSAVSMLLDLEASLKQGQKGVFILPSILAITKLFAHKKARLVR